VRGGLTISIKEIRKKADLWDGNKVTNFLLKNCFCEKGLEAYIIRKMEARKGREAQQQKRKEK